MTETNESLPTSQAFTVNIADITVPENILRGVKQDTAKFQEFLASVRAKGVMQSITVRAKPGGGFYLIDGLQRLTAAKLCGISELPAVLRTANEAEAWEEQLVSNLARIPTAPSDQTKQLIKIMLVNPTLTSAEIARRMGMSVTWVEQRLSLNNLCEEGKKLVDSGLMPLANAYALSQLPETEQPSEFDAACSEQTRTFGLRMAERKKQIRDAKNAGRDASEKVWKPAAHLRTFAVVNAQLEAFTTGKDIPSDNIVDMAAAAGVELSKDAAVAVLKWMLNLDDKSVEAARAKHEAAEAARKAKQEALKAERAAKKAQTEQPKELSEFEVLTSIG